MNRGNLNEFLFGCGAAELLFVTASVPAPTLFVKAIGLDSTIATLILLDCGFIKIG